GALVLLPLLVRNLLTFGAPFYSTEQFDLWILRFYTGGTGLPWEHIYTNYLDGQPLPDRALLLRSYDTLYSAVAWGFRTLWTGGVLGGDILDLPLVLAGAAGWLLAPWRLRPLRYAWIGAFAAYGLFVLLAWHYEARYFLGVVPWFYIGIAAFLLWLWDHLRGNVPADDASDTPASLSTQHAVRSTQHATRNSPAALAVLPLAVIALLWPSVEAIAGRAASDTGPDNFAAAAGWVATHLPPDAVVMTRNPWEFNWYARRKAVMIPEGSVADVQAIASRYDAGYLWVGGRGDSAGLRPQLAPLYRGQPLPGLPATLLYQANGIYIYRLDR
ncbi:MAG TPA: hypothetical protein VFH51_06145, partial [Myxococcota bacterium]|nr:hypothetical protein [Myxococcota bacterium]